MIWYVSARHRRLVRHSTCSLPCSQGSCLSVTYFSVYIGCLGVQSLLWFVAQVLSRVVAAICDTRACSAGFLGALWSAHEKLRRTEARARSELLGLRTPPQSLHVSGLAMSVRSPPRPILWHARCVRVSHVCGPRAAVTTSRTTARASAAVISQFVNANTGVGDVHVCGACSRASGSTSQVNRPLLHSPSRQTPSGVLPSGQGSIQRPQIPGPTTGRGQPTVAPQPSMASRPHTARNRASNRNPPRRPVSNGKVGAGMDRAEPMVPPPAAPAPAPAAPAHAPAAPVTAAAASGATSAFPYAAYSAYPSNPAAGDPYGNMAGGVSYAGSTTGVLYASAVGGDIPAPYTSYTSYTSSDPYAARAGTNRQDEEPRAE